MFSKIGKNTKVYQILSKIHILGKGILLTKKTPAASLKRREWTNPYENLSISINIGFYRILVLNKLLYNNYIALAIVPSWGE